VLLSASQGLLGRAGPQMENGLSLKAVFLCVAMLVRYFFCYGYANRRVLEGTVVEDLLILGSEFSAVIIKRTLFKVANKQIPCKYFLF
jgi:hypothetical protein